MAEAQLPDKSQNRQSLNLSQYIDAPTQGDPKTQDQGSAPLNSPSSSDFISIAPAEKGLTQSPQTPKPIPSFKDFAAQKQGSPIMSVVDSPVLSQPTGVIIPKALQGKTTVEGPLPAVHISMEPVQTPKPKPKITPDLNTSNAVVFQIVHYSNTLSDQLVVDVRPLIQPVEHFSIDAYCREKRDDSPGLTKSKAEMNIAQLNDGVRRVHIRYDFSDQGKLFYLAVNVNRKVEQLLQVLQDPVAYEQSGDFTFPAIFIDITSGNARAVKLEASATSLMAVAAAGRKAETTTLDLLHLDCFPLDSNCMAPPSSYSYTTLEYKRRHGVLFANYGEFALRLGGDFDPSNIFFETLDTFLAENETRLQFQLPRSPELYAVVTFQGLAYLVCFESIELRSTFLLKLLKRCGRLFEPRKMAVKEQPLVLRYHMRDTTVIYGAQKKLKLWEQGKFFTEKDIQLQVDGLQHTTLQEPFNYLVLVAQDGCVHRIRRVPNDVSQPIRISSVDVGLGAILVTKESAHILNQERPVEIFNLNDLDVLKDVLQKKKLCAKAQTFDDGEWVEATVSSSKNDVKMKTKAKRKLTGNYTDARVLAIDDNTVLIGVETTCCLFKTKDDLEAQDLVYFFGMTAGRLQQPVE